MLAENAARARTGLGRLNPFAPTPYAQAHALTNTANDGLTHIVEASQAAAQQFGGDSWGLFKRFLQDPDAPEVVQATGGWSQTKQAKDTALVNRRALGAWDEQGVAFYAAKTATKEAEAKRLAQAANVQAETTRRIVEAEAKVPEKTRLNYTQEQVARLDDTATSARQAADAATAEVARLEAAGADAVQVSAARQVAEEQVKAADDVARQVAAQKARYATPISKRADAALRKAEDAATSARQAQAAAAGLRRAMPTPGDVDVSSIEKLIERARNPETGQVDDLAAVSELARNYELAATSFFATPVKKMVNGVEREVWDYGATGASTKARWLRDNVNNAISVFYMGYNPGYAFRNAANNLITALADGVTPFQSSDHIRQLWTRWGMPPIETKQGIGVAGDVWKSRAAAVEYTRALGQPARLREVMKGVNWKTPTLTLGQNFERYASERIMAHHIKSYWNQVWPRQVKQITTANLDVMRRAGLSAEQIELRVKLAALAMNADELRDALMYGTLPGTARAVPPTAGPATPGLPAPVKPRAPSSTPLVDENQIVPDNVRQAVDQAGGPEAVDDLDAALAHPDPTVRMGKSGVVFAKLENDAAKLAAIDGIDQLAAAAPEISGDPDKLLAYLQDVDNILAQHVDANDVILDQLWDDVKSMPKPERRAAWNDYWRTFEDNLDAVHENVKNFESNIMPSLGFTDEAVARQEARRVKTRETWSTYIKRLKETVAESDDLDWRDPARDELWRSFKQERSDLWAKFNANSIHAFAAACQ